MDLILGMVVVLGEMGSFGLGGMLLPHSIASTGMIAMRSIVLHAKRVLQCSRL